MYHKRLSDLKQHFCNICNELWPSTNLICKNCKDNKVKFSKSNDMVPDFDLPEDIKKQFENLTMIEEMLISPIFAFMSIFRLPGGQYVSRGYMANFSQDIGSLIKQLPHIVKDLPILLIKKKNQKNEEKEFKVNRNRVYICLNFLINNNPHYKVHGIQFNENNLNLLPVDSIPDDLQFIEEDNINDNAKGPEIVENDKELDDDVDNFYRTFVESPHDEQFEEDKLQKTINWPNINPKPINEYTAEGICSMLFPKLFPKGNTNLGII